MHSILKLLRSKREGREEAAERRRKKKKRAGGVWTDLLSYRRVRELLEGMEMAEEVQGEGVSDPEAGSMNQRRSGQHHP